MSASSTTQSGDDSETQRLIHEPAAYDEVATGSGAYLSAADGAALHEADSEDIQRRSCDPLRSLKLVYIQFVFLRSSGRGI
jgi:hypothetical protein